MQKILEDLYAYFDSTCTAPGRMEERKDHFVFAELQRDVLNRLGKDGVGLLNDYDIAKAKLVSDEMMDTFIRGFRLGARLMAAAFDDEYR